MGLMDKPADQQTDITLASLLWGAKNLTSPCRSQPTLAKLALCVKLHIYWRHLALLPLILGLDQTIQTYSKIKHNIAYVAAVCMVRPGRRAQQRGDVLPILFDDANFM